MKFFKAGILVLFLIFNTIAIQAVYAQNTPQNLSNLSNLSNINVNDLTDAQIRQLLQQAQAAGLTDSQVLQQAQNRGMPPDQVQALQKRISDYRKANNIQNGNNGLPNDNDTTQNQSRQLNYKPDTTNNKQTDTLN